LHTQLDAALSHRLTLLSSSAGSGKTTLLATWAARSSLSIAWLSLDDLDNDPLRFWILVITALRTRQPPIGEAALSMLRSPDHATLDIILTTLLNELNDLVGTSVLILEDYHVIHEQAIHESLSFFLDHLQVPLHLVLSSRADPDLPLARWRVRGQLIEIRDRDLLFHHAETTSFLTQMTGLSFSTEDVATLQQRTEGWIAGLQLAALSLRQHENPSAMVASFAGNYRYLLDYVQQEILIHLSARLQDFVLRASILTHMNASLCQAVTSAVSESESQEMLEDLERANLFIVSLDEQRHWYRFHDLFREALLARLQATHADLLSCLHIRAARWYEAADEPREAITHAFRANDYVLAASLIEQAAEHFWLNGEAKMVLTWVMTLPTTVLYEHASLALNAAFYLQESIYWSTDAVRESMQAQIEQGLVFLEAGMQVQKTPGLGEAEITLIQRRIRLLRGWTISRELLRQGNCKSLHHLSQEMEELAREEEVMWKMIPLSLRIILLGSIQRQGALLIPLLSETKHQLGLAGNQLMMLKIMQELTVAYLRAGQLHRARQECLAALALAERMGGNTSTTGYLYLYLARIYAAWDQLDEASVALQQSREIAHRWQNVDLLIDGVLFSAQIALMQGRRVVACHSLQQAEELIQQQRFPLYVFWLAMVRVEYWLATGDFEAANQWAAQTSFHTQAGNPLQTGLLLMRIRVYLAQQQSAQALDFLERFKVEVDQPGDILTTIDALVLQAVALQQMGETAQARAVAGRLLRLSEPNGHLRVYVQAGEPMKQLLESIRSSPQDDDNFVHTPVFTSYIATLLAAIEQEERRKEARECPVYDILDRES
jgi:LuxR family transcriptional regulator, maltose regulon positive regulatory protein